MARKGWYGDSETHVIADPELREKLRKWARNPRGKTHEQIIREHHRSRTKEVHDLLKTAKGQRKGLLEEALRLYKEAEKIDKQRRLK